MTIQNRSYRKKLSSHGIVFMGGKEHPIHVENVSLSGLLAYFQEQSAFSNTEEIFDIIKKTPIVDIYLPEMRVAGLAEIVWVDMVESQIHIALEFKNLTYEITDVLYKRKAYRKAMSAPGIVKFNGIEHLFNTENVSLEGLMIRIPGHVGVEIGTVGVFNFEPLGLSGEAKVVWTDKCEDSTLIGLQYERFKKGDVASVLPRFYS